MTENKRYTLHQNGNYHTVIDEEENVPLIMIEFKENEFPVYACFHRIIDKLNEQEETIQKLKTRNKRQYERLKEKEEYCDNICKSFEDYYGMNIENAEWFGFNGDVK